MLLKKLKIVELNGVISIIIMKRYSNFDLPPNECEICLFSNFSSDRCRKINCSDYDFKSYTYMPHSYFPS